MSVWWHGHCDHEWKAKISDRTVLGKGCIICDHAFQKALPAEAFLYYADKLNLQVQQNDEDQIGAPLQFYLPDQRIAVEISADTSFSEEGLRLENVKNELCQKSGITMMRIVRKTVHGLHSCTCIRLASSDADSIGSSITEVFQVTNPHFKWGFNVSGSAAFLWFRQRRVSQHQEHSR